MLLSGLTCYTQYLLAIVEQLHAKGVQLLNMKEAVDTGTQHGCFIFGAVAELE